MSAATLSDAITLLQLQRRVQSHLLAHDLRDVWVTAELSDVRVNGGHCYMELLQKDENTGKIVAKVRAAAWANVYRSLSHNFKAVTGQEFTTGLKVMLRLSVSYHEIYGMTLVVNDVNPEFTMGDLLRRRRENLLRLQKEGILELNRRLTINRPALRIAIVSAKGAAGFGDFANQLLNNPSRLAFSIKLFPARLQGEGTPASIISALDSIRLTATDWDCVVIIRGGGASSDLIAFEDYNLAAAIARFPLPVIIGIGHERDITLLDYVANMRVKTPTAAAEWLIAEGEKMLDTLRRVANAMASAATARLNGSVTQLQTIETQLRLLPQRCIERRLSRLQHWSMNLLNLTSTHLAPMQSRLERLSEALGREPINILNRNTDQLDSLAKLIEAYSPVATLRRGYTITRCGEATLRSASDVAPGSLITTCFADGQITSAVGNVATPQQHRDQ